MKKTSAAFLNAETINILRTTANESQTIHYSEEFRTLYNLLSATLDKIDTALKYLNSHSEYPKSEEDFVCFLVFACFIVDAKKILFKKLQIKTSDNDFKFFKDVQMRYPFPETGVGIVNDDRFFEYIRSIVFAHPYNTDKHFKNLFGGQVSPWINVNKQFCFMATQYTIDDAIGIRIYSEQKMESDMDIISIYISFNALKNYIKINYRKLALITKKIQSINSEKFIEWEKQKVNRNQDVINILEDIKKILESRYCDLDSQLNKIQEYWNYELKYQENYESVDKYKKYIKSLIAPICDAVDAIDNERLYAILNDCSKRPKSMHKHAGYELEKIFSYLNEKNEIIEPGDDEEWGLTQADLFAKEFAKKWVVINPYDMDYTEISLLVDTACYLEWLEQERK